MRFSLSQLFFTFCALWLFAACGRQHTTQLQTAQKNSIDSLIKNGKKYSGGDNGIDTLNNIAQQLITTAAKTGDKRSLVYGQLYAAQYLWLSGNEKKAMEQILQCLGNAEQFNIRPPLTNIYNVIGNLHKENSNFKLAFDAARMGLYWAKINKDTSAIISSMNLLAMFIHTQRIALNLPPIPESVNLQLAALKIAGTNPRYNKLRIILYDNMISYYLGCKDYENAIRYGLMGVALATKYNQQRSLTYSYVFLGQAYFETGKRQQGLDLITKALKIARQLKQPYREMEIYENLYSCYYSTGDYKTAIHYNMLSTTLKDSLAVTQNEKQVSELELKYQTAKKNREITQINHDKTITYHQLLAVLAGCLLFIVLTVILLLQYRIIKRSNTMMNRSNINKDKALVDIAYFQSHGLRKPLASILGLINVIRTMEDKVDPECLDKLEQASLELDNKIHAIISQVDSAKED